MRLITPSEYIAAEQRHEGHVEAMAIDLTVTVDIIEALQRVLFRTERGVYVDPRMGAGQWQHLVELA